MKLWEADEHKVIAHLTNGHVIVGKADCYTSEQDEPNGVASIIIGDGLFFENEIESIELADEAKGMTNMKLREASGHRVTLHLTDGTSVTGLADCYTSALDEPDGVASILIDNAIFFENEIESIELA